MRKTAIDLRFLHDLTAMLINRPTARQLITKVMR